MLKNVKRRLLNKLLAHLFNAVTEEDALTRDKTSGRLRYQNTLLEKEDELTLAREAATIKNMLLWKVLAKSMKWEANKKMYYDSTSDDDIVAGKWCLWTMEVLEQKVSNLTKLNK